MFEPSVRLEKPMRHRKFPQTRGAVPITHDYVAINAIQ